MTVIQTEHLSPQAATWLAERADLVVGDAESAAFAAAAPRAAALVVRTYTQVNDALLARLPALRAVGRAGVGLDNIDLDACARRMPAASCATNIVPFSLLPIMLLRVIRISICVFITIQIIFEVTIIHFYKLISFLANN